MDFTDLGPAMTAAENRDRAQKALDQNRILARCILIVAGSEIPQPSWDELERLTTQLRDMAK